MTVLSEIAAERTRQISEEGWTPEHDDTHTQGEMATAAACYAYMASATDHQRAVVEREGAPYRWPWSRLWWKPKDRRRDLIRAAALIVAEIERLDRAEGR